MPDRIEKLKAEIKNFPNKPGIYFFLGKDNQILYIGKARSLQNRVKSYFLPTLDAKVNKILSETNRMDYILTESEREAAFLENNFIQQYQPKFNERLKDDKSFPYLKLTLQDDYPGIYLTRRVEPDGARYFGPFNPASQARKTILLLNKYFGIRDCRENIPGKRSRPCLEYDLKLCSAPCVEYINSKDYQERVQNALLLLEGKVAELLKILKHKMDKASQTQEFEEAAHWRDLIFTLEQIKEKPRFITVQSENKDIFGYAHKQEKIGIYVFLMRKGKVIQSHTDFRLMLEQKSDKTQLFSELMEFYTAQTDYPDKILIPFWPENLEDLTQKLKKLKGAGIEIHVPVRGKNRKLVQMASRNAALLLERLDQEQNPILELKEILGLKHEPNTIEGYDISNTGGQESVGSRVVFKLGKPYKNGYRKYRIRSVEGPDDVACLKEVLQRRFSSSKGKAGKSPDLVLVDGGKGQWHAAMQVLKTLSLESLPVCSLAKKEEILFSDLHPNGLHLDCTSPALQLVQNIRNEAHRFALTFHRRRRTQKSFGSILDDIPGIGPKRKQILLTHFQGPDDIRCAPIPELGRLIGEKAAQTIKEHFSGEKSLR